MVGGGGIINPIISWFFPPVQRCRVRFVIWMCAYVMLQSRNGPYIISPLPVDNQSYFTPVDIIFQPVFAMSCIYSFSHYTILMRIHVVLWSSGNSWNSWRCFCLCQTRISGTMKCYTKLSSMKKIFDKNVWYFLCHVLHDLWPPKGVILAKFLSPNTSNNLEIVCQCDCASPDNLWQLMGTAWAWQYRHIRLGYALRRYYVTNLARIGANFRNFKLIVGHIDLITVRYFWSVAHWQWVTSSVAWHCIYLEMYLKTV